MEQTTLAKVVAFLRAHPETYLATVSGDIPWVRAMHAARVEEDGTVWYATARSTSKVAQLAQNPKVSLAVYADGQHARVFGTAVVIDDTQTKHDLWEEDWRVYFAGKDDPQYVLIKVTPERVELT